MDSKYDRCLAQQRAEGVNLVGTLDDCVDDALRNRGDARHQAFAAVNCVALHAAVDLNAQVECGSAYAGPMTDYAKGQLIDRSWRQSFLDATAFGYNGQCPLGLCGDVEECTARHAVRTLFKSLPIPDGH